MNNITDFLAHLSKGNESENIPSQTKKVTKKINFVLDNPVSEKNDFNTMSNGVLDVLESFAGRVLDPEKKHTIVTGMPLSGKTFFIEQLAYHMDEFLEKTKLDKIYFIKFNDLDLHEIANAENIRIFCTSLCNLLRCDDNNICFVTESPEVALNISIVLPSVRVILEINESTLDNLIASSQMNASKFWTSWQMIEVSNIEYDKEDVINLLVTVQKNKLSNDFKNLLTKRQISTFVNRIINSNPNIVDKGLVLPPPGIWVVSLRMLLSNLAFTSNKDYYKDNKIDYNKIIDKTLEEVIELFNVFDEEENSLPDDITKFFSDEALQFMGMKNKKVNANDSKPENEKIKFKDILNLNTRLKKNIMGQDEAIDKISEGMIIAAAGLNNPNKPLRSFLFAGKTGTGKTQLALDLAKEVDNKPLNVVRIDMSEYQQEHEVAKLFGCFLKDSKVWLSDGTMKNIQDVVVGDKVVTHKGQIRKVIDTHIYDYSNKIMRIKSAGCYDTIKCTPQHEIFAIKSDPNNVRSKDYTRQKKSLYMSDENKLEWVKAEEIRKYDWVAVPRPKIQPEDFVYDLIDYSYDSNINNRYKTTDNTVFSYNNKHYNRFISVNNDFARLAGYYLSEGGSNDKGINFTFHEKETDYINDVINLMIKVFGKDLTYKIKYRPERSNTRIYFGSRIIKSFFVKLFGNNVYSKKIPYELLNSHRSVRINLIETMFLGDGSLVVPNRIDYSTVSSQLSAGFNFVLRSLGYDPYTSREIPENTNWSPRYRIYLSGSQLKRLNDETTDMLQIITNDLIKDGIRNIKGTENYTLYRVLESSFIENSENKVYDLSVDEDTSYTINGLAVHNSPPGYVGYDEGGVLTNKVKENPKSVIILDEIEKAHPKVWDSFLQVLDAGRMTDSQGQEIDFKQTIIIMTSNIGVTEVDKKSSGFSSLSHSEIEKDNQKIIMNEIKKNFRPEFINRIDDIIYFKDLSEETAKAIAVKEIKIISDRMKNKGYSIRKPKDEIINIILKKADISHYGAREIQRIVSKDIANPIAYSIIKDNNQKIFELASNNDEIFVKKPNNIDKTKTGV